jgi:hypothetical protein
MPSVAKEINVPLKQLEAIQRLHRSLLSALEMIASATPAGPECQAMPLGAGKRDPRGYAVRATLIAMARALRFGSHPRAWLPADGRRPRGVAPTGSERRPIAAPQAGGREWLAERFAEQVDQLSALLAETEAHWNIERRPEPAPRSR